MTLAKIASANTKGTGITETHADQWWPKLGHGVIAIVELIVADHNDPIDGERGIKLRIQTLEPANDAATESHLRDLQRALYLTRQEPGFDGLQVAGEDKDEIIRRGENLILRCPICLALVADDRIVHWKGDVDADGAWCSWKVDGSEVKAGQDEPDSDTVEGIVEGFVDTIRDTVLTEDGIDTVTLSSGGKTATIGRRGKATATS